jgi:hypothetical protein
MVEVGIAEYFGMAEALGIIANAESLSRHPNKGSQ